MSCHLVVITGLDIGLSLNKADCLCLVCGHTESVNMVDISLELSGIKIADKIEDIVSRKILADKHSSLLCNDCYAILEQIDRLEIELLKFKRTITSKFSVSNPVKPKKTSPKKGNSSLPVTNQSLFPEYSESIIDTKVPLQFQILATEKEIERDLEHIQEKSKKSKLDILAETMEEFEEGAETGPGPGGLRRENNEYECELCLNKYSNNSLYQKHLKTHSKQKIHNCSECGKQFSSKSNLQAHLKLHFETTTFTCPHCCKDFKGKKSLLEHVSSKHNNEKKFSCSHCLESFSSRHLKNVHERTHNGEKGYICDQCGDSFATAQGLSHHKSKHTGDYQYRCKVCEKGFNNYKLLEEHHHIHTGNKPYKCKTCEKGFANRGSLWIHMKKHQETKPYVCPECQKSFTHSSHLAVHKRIHSGEKPYRCRICAEGFISSNHLKRHMKSHSNQHPFACGACKQTFSQKRQLVVHSNKLHGGHVLEDIVADLPSKVIETPEQTTTILHGDAGDTIGIGDGGNYSLMPVMSIVEGGEIITVFVLTNFC